MVRQPLLSLALRISPATFANRPKSSASAGMPADESSSHMPYKFCTMVSGNSIVGACVISARIIAWSAAWVAISIFIPFLLNGMSLSQIHNGGAKIGLYRRRHVIAG